MRTVQTDVEKDIADFLIAYKKISGKDNISHKEKIKKILLNNPMILYLLNNPDLDIESPDDFFGTNIFPYYILPMTQTDVKNYICFETSFTEVARYNDIMKLGHITFYILCDNKTIQTDYPGVARHDLIGALIDDEFNWSSKLGIHLKLVEDRERAVDNNYIARIMVFEQTTLNSITSNKKVINKSRFSE